MGAAARSPYPDALRTLDAWTSERVGGSLKDLIRLSDAHPPLQSLAQRLRVLRGLLASLVEASTLGEQAVALVQLVERFESAADRPDEIEFLKQQLTPFIDGLGIAPTRAFFVGLYIYRP